MLAEPQPDQPGGVKIHSDERESDLGQLRIAELLQRMHVLLVSDQAVGRLLVGALGVPAVPHRLERVPADRLRLAQRIPGSIIRPISAPLPRCDRTWAIVQSLQ